MLNPQLVLAMAEYLRASEALADATDDLIKANETLRQGMSADVNQCLGLVELRLKVYRQARHNWENLQ